MIKITQLTKYWPLLLALGVGIFMRSYQALERFNYSHDSDLASWIIKDIVVDKHPRLIGQLTSSPGIFIGPLFYYLQIPFYVAGGMDPKYVVLIPALLGLASIASLYYVMNKIFSTKEAAIASLLFAASWGITFTEREIVPTAPVYLWSIWFLYACHLVIRGQKKGLMIVAVLWGLIWHINLALVVTIPLFLGLLAWFRNKFKWQDLILPFVVVMGLSLPFFAFEARHNFGQIRAMTESIGRSSQETNLSDKAVRVVLYLSKNANGLFWQKPDSVSYYLLPMGLLLLAVYLWKSKTLPGMYLGLFLAWLGLYVVEFSLYPINLSEYYLNGVNIVWVVIAALALARLGKMAVVVMSVLVIQNSVAMISAPIDHSGYIEKKAITQFITQDAKLRGYPCVAVSYMTDPGRNFGYRYWFYLNGLHVNQPKSESPVYTIVFPHTRAGELDRTFGSLGLVLPDYKKYTSEGIAKSCEGENANLTDPMFGFTK